MSDHKAHAHPAPSRTHPTNPLGHPYGATLFLEHDHPRQASQLANLCQGIHAVALILANNERLRDIQINTTEVEPGNWTLADNVTVGLFAALYDMREQVDLLTQPG